MFPHSLASLSASRHEPGHRCARLCEASKSGHDQALTLHSSCKSSIIRNASARVEAALAASDCMIVRTGYASSLQHSAAASFALRPACSLAQPLQPRGPAAPREKVRFPQQAASAHIVPGLAHLCDRLLLPSHSCLWFYLSRLCCAWPGLILPCYWCPDRRNQFYRQHCRGLD